MAKSWRWAFWIMLWLAGGALLFLVISMPEVSRSLSCRRPSQPLTETAVVEQTSSQNILYRRAARLRKLTGNEELKSEGEIEQSKMSFGEAAKMTLVKPFVLNFAEPVVFANNLFIVCRCGFILLHS